MADPNDTPSLAVAASLGATAGAMTIDRHGRSLLRHSLELCPRRQNSALDARTGPCSARIGPFPSGPSGPVGRIIGRPIEYPRDADWWHLVRGLDVPRPWVADSNTVLPVNSEPDCLFCGIVAGTIPSTTIAQTEQAIAFMDINPVTPGHALVIPRAHAADLLDTTADDLAACIILAQQIAQRAKDRLGADGVNLLNCTGEAAWQTVFHFHIHIILRFKDEPGKDRIGLPWDTVPSNLDEITRIGNLLS